MCGKLKKIKINQKNKKKTHTHSHNDAISIERVAKSIASSGFLANFRNAFVPGYLRGQWCFDLWLIAEKSADVFKHGKEH